MLSPSGQAVSPAIIGRVTELDALGRALEKARQAQGQCILITGEAGIGKSRLVAELQRRAAARGFKLLLGQCFEQDLAFPYSLWVSALRNLFSSSNAAEIRQALGPLAPVFVKILPELSLLVPGLEPALALDPESEKRRLFEGVARFLANLSASGPLLLALEDLHWSDEASLNLLHTISRRLPGRSILIVATYRSDEVTPQLAHFIGEMNRERGALEFALAPLIPADSLRMIRSILGKGHRPKESRLFRLVERTEGNPFFIEETVRLLVESGYEGGITGARVVESEEQAKAPETVSGAVLRRTRNLSSRAVHILSLAAVAGQRMSFELLREVSGLNEPELLPFVRELLDAQLLIEESADRLSFRHALTREAVYGHLLLRERWALHRLVGAALERSGAASSPARVADLAYHTYHAGEWEKAIQYSLQAGSHAAALYAPREAAAHFTSALDAARRLGASPPLSALRGRAQALQILGDFERARDDYEGTLQTAIQSTDRHDEWRALIDLGFLWQSRDLERAGSYFERALDLARSLGEIALVAQTLNRIGNWHMNRARPGEAVAYHRQALDCFRGLNDPRGIGQTLELLGLASIFAGQMVQGAAYCEEALPILRRLDDRQGLVNTLTNLSLRPRFDTEVLGEVDLRQLAGLSDEAREIARSCDYRQGEADALTRGAVCLCRVGEYGRGLEYLDRAMAVAGEIEHRQLFATVHLACGIELYSGVLALKEARENLEVALATAQELGSALLSMVATAHLARVCILQNDLQRAQELLDTVLTADLPEAPEMDLLLRGCWAARAELELARGNPRRALEIVDWLLAGTINLKQYGPYAVPRLTWLKGRSLAALGRMEEAAAEFRGAVEVTRAQGQLASLWQLHADLGHAYLALGGREEARGQFSSARAVIRDLTKNIPKGALRTNFRRQALAAVPASPAATKRRATLEEFGGLTERERQVAALVAEGKSNRDIAETLVVSVKTVERHVANIMSKLGFHSRSQIAAWAMEKGIAQRSTNSG